MKIFNKKIIASFLLAASLLLSGCGKDKNSNTYGNSSPTSNTTVITGSITSSSQSSGSSSEVKDESKTAQSSTKLDSKSSDLGSSDITLTSGKTTKSKNKKTNTSVNAKAKKTSAKTSIQKRTTTVTCKSSNQNVQTTASAKNSEVTEKNEFLVSVEIECKTAVGSKDLNSSVKLPSNGIILPRTEIKVKQGESVLDVTKAICEKNDIPIICLNGSYVKSIGPIGEKQCGKFSGWTYKVNGKKPSKSSDKYILEEDDTLVWSFVTTY